MSLYKYRIYPLGTAKAEAIVDSRTAAEAAIPHGEQRIVRRYQGRVKLATYLVDRDMRGGCRWRVHPPDMNTPADK